MPCGRNTTTISNSDAVDQLLHAGKLPTQDATQFGHAFGEQSQKRRADDRTEERADAADDRPEDDFDGAADVENLLGKKIVVVETR